MFSFKTVSQGSSPHIHSSSLSNTLTCSKYHIPPFKHPTQTPDDKGNLKTLKRDISSFYQFFLKLGSLLITYVTNILNSPNALQESQRNTPTLDENPKYQNTTISQLYALKFDHNFKKVYPQVLVLFPLSYKPTRNIFYTNNS